MSIVVRTPARLLAAAVATALAATSLSACAGADAAGAEAAATRYAELVATAGADELEELWALSAEGSTTARIAGDLLVGASERIEVLEVGAASAVDEWVSADAIGSDLDPGAAVQVPIAYAIDGSEHDAAVVLAPYEDGPRSEPSTWRVVRGLLGEVQLSATGFAALTADAYVSDERLEVDRSFAGATVQLLPGVYDTQLRGDPYLAAEAQPLTVVAGSSTAFPDAPLVITDEGATALQQQTDAFFEGCGVRLIECPMDVYDAVDDAGIPYPWTSALSVAPTLAVEGTEVTLSGGAFVVQDAGGPVTVTFSGTGRWLIDNQSWRPVVATWDLDLDVEVQR